MYARIENNQIAEYPLTEHEIKSRFPNTSFTTDFASCLPEGYEAVRPGSIPADDPLKVVSEGHPSLVDSVWVRTWVQSDKFTAEELQAMDAQKTADKWVQLRDARNEKISECSWIIERHRDQKDAGLPTSITEQEYGAWLLYRQQLRDFPPTVTDIDNVQWPSAPSDLAITVL